MGVTLEGYEPEKPTAFEIWPENMAAVDLFMRCSSQWRMGPSGATGLDYTALFRLLDLYAITDPRDTFERVQIMEFAVLRKLNEKAAA